MLSFNFKYKMPEGMSRRMLQGLKDAARKGTLRAADVLIGELREASSHGPLRGRTGMLARSWAPGPVAEDAGDLRITITPKVSARDADKTGLEVGSSVPYAAIQQAGGIVRPVKAKALTIPAGANLTERGVPRYPTVKSLRQALGDKNVFQPKGKDYIMGLKGRKKAELYFVLKQQVKVPASGYITEAVKRARDGATEEIRKAIIGHGE